MSTRFVSTKEIYGDCNFHMEVCGFICHIIIFGVVIWGVIMVLLLLMGGFIKIRTWGNFNCGFGMWESNVSFDRIKLLVVFVVFEMEVLVVVMVISGLIVTALLGVTCAELIILYI